MNEHLYLILKKIDRTERMSDVFFENSIVSGSYCVFLISEKFIVSGFTCAFAIF